MLGIADDGEGGEEVPDAAPCGCGKAAPRGDGGIEEDIDGVCGGGGGCDSECEPGIDGCHGDYLKAVGWRE